MASILGSIAFVGFALGLVALVILLGDDYFFRDYGSEPDSDDELAEIEAARIDR